MAIDLLVLDETPNADAAVYFGGLPESPDPEGFNWPRRATCSGALQYLGRVPHPAGASKRILIFQCANDPGMCDDWDPSAGGNAAAVIDAAQPGTTIEPPADGDTALSGQWSCRIHAVEADDFPAAWERAEQDGLQVLGQLGGEAAWIQADETPDCAACGRPMAFVAQMLEGPDPRAAMNFGGGGCGYVFACAGCGDSASFLWQS